MNRNLLTKLCCPFDKNDLIVQVFKETEDQQILEGLLTCPHCQRYFPIIYGIPIMTPDEYREKHLELPSLKKWGLEISPDQDRFRISTPSKSKELDI